MIPKLTLTLGRANAVSVLAALLFLTTAVATLGQEPLPQGDIAPNEEASSNDTLMDRTDLGNVAQAARMQLDQGVRELNQANKLLMKVSETTDSEKREKTEKKALKSAERAEKAFREALGYNASLIDAYAGLGTSLRILGRSEEALQVHALALRRYPDDLANFQGWTRALLDLNMLGNATTAYTDYSSQNPARAEILMTEIKNWLAIKQSDPGDLDPADVERLAAWVEQQSQG